MSNTRASGFSRYRPILLRIAGTLVLFAALMLLVDVKQTTRTLGALRLDTVVLAALLALLSWLIAIAKWKLLLRKVPFGELTRFHFIGMLYNQILPGQIAGEAIKAVRLAKGRDDVGKIAASVLVDRLTGLVGLGIVAGAGLLLSPLRIPQLQAIGGMIVIGTLAFTAALFASRLPWLIEFTTRKASALEQRPGLVGRAAHAFHHFLDAWRTYVRDPMLVVASIAFGILFQAVGALIVKVLAVGLGIELSFSDGAWVLGIVSVAILLPVSLGGLGVRELGFVAILGLIGIASPHALSLAIACSAITLFGALLGLAVELFQLHGHRL